MNSSQRSISILGIALILIGLAIILHRFGVIDFGFHQIFWPLVMLLGLTGVVRGFSRGRRGKIFWGTLWFLYGLFFFLRSLEFVEVRGHLIVPATFLILGISFLMMYINDVREWAYLIPSVILAGVGVVVLLADTEYLSGYEVYDILHTYWPVGLILVGIAIILRRRDRGVPPGFPPGGPTSGGADSVGGDPPASAIPSNPPAA